MRAHQKHLAGKNGGGLCALTAVLGGTTLFPDMPSKGPCCNSNIIAIIFEGLNCQERMMATTGHRAIKDELAADCSLRFFGAAVAKRPSLPCSGGDRV